MPPSLTSTAVLAMMLLILKSSTATPLLSFAINSQVPPVAYVSQHFEYTFSAETFVSSEQAGLEYSLVDGPHWLAIDSKSRKLSGEPLATDVGSAQVKLVASDGDGEVFDDVTLVVVEDRTLTVGEDILSQLEAVGSTSPPASLLLRPLESFSFQLAEKIFDGTTVDTEFYALSADSSPLPPWMQFDAAALRFAGIAPALPATKPAYQTYSFSLAASNIRGFAEVGVQFQFVVSTKVLAFSPSRMMVKITNSGEVVVPSLLTHLFLDGLVVEREYLTSVVTSKPDWLELNETDLSFFGSAPDGAQNYNFDVSVTGREDNAANVSVMLTSSEQPASQTYLGIWNVTVGQNFVLAVPAFPKAKRNLFVETDLGPLASWLSFDATTSTIYGQIPADVMPDRYNVSITFSSDATVKVFSLTIHVMSDEIDTATHQSASPTTALVVSGSTSPHNNDSNGKERPSHKDIVLGLTIGLPLLAVILVAGLIVCLMRYTSLRARHKGTEYGVNSPDSHEASVTNQTTKPGSSAGLPKVVAEIPQGKLSWVAEAASSRERVEATAPATQTIKTSRPDWNGLISPLAREIQEDVPTSLPTIHVPKRRQPRPTQSIPHQRNSLISLHAKPMGHHGRHRSSKSSSLASLSTLGLANRVSGAGHGAGTTTTLYQPGSRSSWYTTFGSGPMPDGKHSSAVLNSFPAPPSRSNTMKDLAVLGDESASRTRSKWRTPRTNSAEPGSFEEARQRYYTNRARDQLEGASRFSNTSSKSLTVRKVPSSMGRSRGVYWGSGPTTTRERPTVSWSQRSRGSSSPRKDIVNAHDLLKREASVASSGQFDSALSSDSQ